MGSIRRLSGVTTLTIAAMLVLAASGAAERQRTAPPMAVDRAAQGWWGSAGVGVEVRDRDGHPVAGAEVQLAFSEAGSGSEGPAAVRTDASGRAAVRGLAEGEWVLTIRHPETMAYVATLQVREGKRAREKNASQVKVNDSLQPLRLKYFEESGPAEHPMQPAAPAPPQRARDRVPARTPPVEQAVPAPERPAAPREEAQPPAEPMKEPATAEAMAPKAEPVDAAAAPEAPSAEPMAAEEPMTEPEKPAKAAKAAEEPMTEPATEPMAGSEAPAAEAEAPAAEETEPAAEEAEPAAGEMEPAAEGMAPASETEEPAAGAEPAMGGSEPMPAVEPPRSEPEQPAPTPPPQPMTKPSSAAPAPAAASATAAPRRSTLRSNEAGTCPECRPGEWSVTTEGIAAPGTGACPDDLKARVNRAAALLGSSRALGPWTGPIEIAGGAASVLGNEAYGQFTGAVREVLADDATCRVLAVMLPAGGTFVGLEMAADDGGTWRLCLPGKECVAGSGWTGDPWVVRTPAGPLVVGAYGNGGSEPRRARLTVYFTAPEGWAPR